MFDLKNTPHPIVKASSGKTIKIIDIVIPEGVGDHKYDGPWPEIKYTELIDD